MPIVKIQVHSCSEQSPMWQTWDKGNSIVAILQTRKRNQREMKIFAQDHTSQ